MHRRQFVALAGAIVVAGCSADSSGQKPTTVSVEGEGVSGPDGSQPLQATYSTETRSELPTDPPTRAEDGHKWVLVELQLENTGTDAIDVDPQYFVLKAGGSRYEFTAPGGEDWALEAQTVAAGETISGSVAFHVPEEVTSATVTSSGNIGVSFSSS